MIQFLTSVTDIFERKIQKHSSGLGKDAIFTTESIGWYIQLGGVITVHVGDAAPAFTKGDKITMTLEKV
jgi:hypothetical protein